MTITRKAYYMVPDIQYELVHQMIRKHKGENLAREVFFLPIDKEKKRGRRPIRWILALYKDMLIKQWNFYNFFKENMNLYTSLSSYRDFPMFSWNWRAKSQQQKIWEERYHKHVETYDLFIETDSKDLKESIERDARKIKSYFDEKKIRYHIKYSGSKGCHIIVDYDDFTHLGIPVFNKEHHEGRTDFKTFIKRFPMNVEQMREEIDLVLLFKVIALRIRLLLNAPTVDTSVQDVKRVVKAAYSWDVKSGLIAYPLSDAWLEKFDTRLVTPRNVLAQNNHKRRLLWRHDDVPLSNRQEHVSVMLKELDILS